jgi:hypothetical protein
MTIDGDAFVSYAHIDNVGLVEGQKGWVANLHRLLETRVAQRLGRSSKIWRDPKLAGNDVLTDTLVARLRQCAALVSVLSPGYINSEWCLKELDEFCKAARAQGHLTFAEKSRIFKVIKTPVQQEDVPPELQSLIGYKFYKRDPETGRVRELDELHGQEERDFWLKLDDLVHDLCELIELAEAGAEGGDPSTTGKGTVFLAETTRDLADERDAIKRDLQQQGYLVLPARELPRSAEEAAAAIREDLGRCQLSVHMIGRNYSLVPEGGVASLQELQNDLAIERGEGFSRLVWIPRNLKVMDARQQKVIDRLRMDQRIQEGSDLLETSVEDLKTAISMALQPKKKAKDRRPRSDAAALQVYLQYDSRDTDVVAPWADFLFTDFEVIPPVFSGDEADLRLYHEENLRTCDGVLILYGSGSELWLRRKLAELQKSAGYGRTKPMPEVAICLIPPQTPEKTRLRTHRARVIPQWDGLVADLLLPFVSDLKTRGEEARRDGTGDTV